MQSPPAVCEPHSIAKRRPAAERRVCRGGKLYPSDKNFDDLTPAEKTAAKALARTKKIAALRVCADPGNMPLSNIKGEGYENKIAEVLAKAMDTQGRISFAPPTSGD